mgnify:CR=1 FL=1
MLPEVSGWEDCVAPSGDIIIGVDAGTSVIKAVAFSLAGAQLGVSSVRNSYQMGADGSF